MTKAFENGAIVGVQPGFEDEVIEKVMNENQTKTIKGAGVEMNKTMDKGVEVSVEEAKKNFMAARKAKQAATATQTKTNEKVEKEMNKTVEGTKGKAVMGGRKLNKANATKGKNGALVKNGALPQKGNGSAKLSKKPKAMNYDKVEKSSGFEKFEGPWYLNASLYPVMDRFADILETREDAELGITNLLMLDPDDVFSYDNHGQLAVVQVKFGSGITVNVQVAESNGNADLSSRNIQWVETKNNRKLPTYAFSHPNDMQVKLVCTCGANNYVGVNAEEIKCYKCDKKHELDVEVSSETAKELQEVKWATVSVPRYHLNVNKDVLALALALVQYEAGFDMYAVGEEEDAE